MRRRRAKLTSAIALVGLVCCVCWQPVKAGRPESVQEVELPEGAGKTELLSGCTTCHTTERIVALRGRLTEKQWSSTIAQMVQNGLDATSVDVDVILDYLVRNFAKIDKVNVNRANRAELITAFSLSEKEADAFLDYRGKHGDFKTFADLLVIDGVDVRKIEAAKDRVEFN